MTEASDLERALRKRLLKMIEDSPIQGAPSVNVYAGGAMPQTVSEALSAGGGTSTQKQMEATKAGISPEELEYLVDISKRDVTTPAGIDQETGEPKYRTIGWDKKVHRYTQPRADDMSRMKNKKKKPQDEAGLSSLFGEEW